MKNIIGIAFLIGGLLFAAGRGYTRLKVNQEYQTKIESFWDLADRASTISQKSYYISKYVNALEKQNLQGVNNALFFPTPESDFSQNMTALKSLEKRLKEISAMDESSFAYQTAIHQITEQEQGGGAQMTDHLKNCWYKKYHHSIWHPLIGTGYALLQIIIILIGFAVLSWDNED